MKFKANILLITLFLLMMSSLSALLVTAYIKNLIQLSAAFHNYYQSYYIANAGLELALVKTNGNVRGFGFEDTVGPLSKTVTDNLSCGTGCSFTTTISATSSTLAAINTSDPLLSDIVCNESTVGAIGYEIPPGGCVPIILLQDDQYGDGSSISGSPTEEGKLEFIADTRLKSSLESDIDIYATQSLTVLLTNMEIRNNKLFYNTGFSKTFEAGSQGSNQPSNIYKIPQAINSTMGGIGSNDKLILMLANTSNSTGSYCVNGGTTQKLATQYVTVNSQGQYRNTNLKLKGVRKAGLPADFCYTIISN